MNATTTEPRPTAAVYGPGLEGGDVVIHAGRYMELWGIDAPKFHEGIGFACAAAGLEVGQSSERIQVIYLLGTEEEQVYDFDQVLAYVNSL